MSQHAGFLRADKRNLLAPDTVPALIVEEDFGSVLDAVGEVGRQCELAERMSEMVNFFDAPSGVDYEGRLKRSD